MSGFIDVGVALPRKGSDDQAGIVDDIARNRDFFLVVVQAVTAAHHDPVVELTGLQAKPSSGPKLSFCEVQAFPL